MILRKKKKSKKTTHIESRLEWKRAEKRRQKYKMKILLPLGMYPKFQTAPVHCPPSPHAYIDFLKWMKQMGLI